MADIRQLPVMTAADAQSVGFAAFNDVPHYPIDLPDADFTLTAKTSDGRRLTIFFGVYGPGRPPEYADIRYHDAETAPAANGGGAPVFDFFSETPGGIQTFHTHALAAAAKPSLVCIPMDRSPTEDGTPYAA